MDERTTKLRRLLEVPESSARLQAALAAGTDPATADIPVLVERCRVEPDFYVRDMLTWALTQHPADATVPRLLDELRMPQVPGDLLLHGRAQALHTLSKIGDARAWPAVTDDLLADADDEVARAAWRAAVVVVPDDQRESLAQRLAGQLGRGDRAMQLSLSRAFVELGSAADQALAQATDDKREAVRLHALATQRLVQDPDSGFDAAVAEAKRYLAVGS
ncbi:HEAT repeat domain-containing protein [Propionimicrobium sp. PCR01-08-3]|uniref:HEAT repeat domain-containing protein n=1 Tax=Propionimicrobium sp. PCR01-08-3 TaxID=3052086 RepID=UPI00255C6068|nr:HEAT repeat domain-containing protein [Propionimicrobium sp. PCR01-08-3]WIY83106.1 HEAT repeat domain-containing protein [Propionimicrobium sp. PCR01-08-3]